MFAAVIQHFRWWNNHFCECLLVKRRLLFGFAQKWGAYNNNNNNSNNNNNNKLYECIYYAPQNNHANGEHMWKLWSSMGFRAGYWLLYGCQVTSPDKKQKNKLSKPATGKKKQHILQSHFQKPAPIGDYNQPQSTQPRLIFRWLQPSLLPSGHRDHLRSGMTPCRGKSWANGVKTWGEKMGENGTYLQFQCQLWNIWSLTRRFRAHPILGQTQINWLCVPYVFPIIKFWTNSGVPDLNIVDHEIFGYPNKFERW